MAYPLDNLGGYNEVRILLQKFNGDTAKFYKYIGDLAVKKSAPKYFALGGAAFLAVSAVVQYGVKLYKDHKTAIAEEPAVRAVFEEVVESCVAQTEDNLPPVEATDTATEQP